MAYQKTQWKDHIEGVQVGTPVNAVNMNKIEEGIAAACAIGDAEGTWTPSAVEMRNRLDGNTYERRIGYYVRIGKLIVATFDVAVSTKSTGSNWDNVTQVCIQGLPGTLARQDTAYHMGARIVKSTISSNTIAATTALAYGTVAFVTHEGPLNTNVLGDGFQLRGSIAYMTTD